MKDAPLYIVFGPSAKLPQDITRLRVAPLRGGAEIPSFLQVLSPEGQRLNAIEVKTNETVLLTTFTSVEEGEEPTKMSPLPLAEAIGIVIANHDAFNRGRRIIIQRISDHVVEHISPQIDTENDYGANLPLASNDLPDITITSSVKIISVANS